MRKNAHGCPNEWHLPNGILLTQNTIPFVRVLHCCMSSCPHTLSHTNNLFFPAPSFLHHLSSSSLFFFSFSFFTHPHPHPSLSPRLSCILLAIHPTHHHCPSSPSAHHSPRSLPWEYLFFCVARAIHLSGSSCVSFLTFLIHPGTVTHNFTSLHTIADHPSK